MLMLEINLNEAIREIKKRKAKIVAVQIPEGLKTRALEIASEIEKKTGAKTLTFVEPCFGACDLADWKSKILGADMLLHFGHTKIYTGKIPAVFLPLDRNVNARKLEKLLKKLENELNEIKAGKVALCTTAQYLGKLGVVKKNLQKNGFKVYVGKVPNMKSGQILGCNYGAVKNVEKKADVIVYFGDGLFHPLGVALATGKRVIIADPINIEVKVLDDEKEKFLRKRFAQIEIAKKACIFGILVSTKAAQSKMKKALELKKLIESKGKKAVIFASDLINADYLLGIKVEALVNTACPRICVDDFANFKVPLLNPKELEIALGKRAWEKYELE